MLMVILSPIKLTGGENFRDWHLWSTSYVVSNMACTQPSYIIGLLTGEISTQKSSHFTLEITEWKDLGLNLSHSYFIFSSKTDTSLKGTRPIYRREGQQRFPEQAIPGGRICGFYWPWRNLDTKSFSPISVLVLFYL